MQSHHFLPWIFGVDQAEPEAEQGAEQEAERDPEKEPEREAAAAWHHLPFPKIKQKVLTILGIYCQHTSTWSLDRCEWWLPSEVAEEDSFGAFGEQPS